MIVVVVPLKRYIDIETTRNSHGPDVAKRMDARRVCFVYRNLCFVEREGVARSPVTLWRFLEEIANLSQK